MVQNIGRFGMKVNTLETRVRGNHHHEQRLVLARTKMREILKNKFDTRELRDI